MDNEIIPTGRKIHFATVTVVVTETVFLHYTEKPCSDKNMALPRWIFCLILRLVFEREQVTSLGEMRNKPSLFLKVNIFEPYSTSM